MIMATYPFVKPSGFVRLVCLVLRGARWSRNQLHHGARAVRAWEREALNDTQAFVKSLGTTTLLGSTTNLEKRSLALGEWKPRYETCNQPRLHPQVWLCVRGPLRDVLARILLGPYPRLLLQVCTLEVVEWPHHLVSG